MVNKYEKNNVKQYVMVFHYLGKHKTVETILKEGVMFPSDCIITSFYNEEFVKSRINFTTIPPENGIEDISKKIFRDPETIKYCLELIMDPSLLRRSNFSDENTYHVYTEDPLQVKVVRVWNMERLMRSPKKINRKTPAITYLDKNLYY